MVDMGLMQQACDLVGTWVRSYSFKEPTEEEEAAFRQSLAAGTSWSGMNPSSTYTVRWGS